MGRTDTPVSSRGAEEEEVQPHPTNERKSSMVLLMSFLSNPIGKKEERHPSNSDSLVIRLMGNILLGAGCSSHPTIPATNAISA